MLMDWNGEERRKNKDNTQQEIISKLDRIIEFIDGNGKPGAKVLLDRHDRTLAVVIWVGGLLVVSSLGFAGWVTQQAFSKLFYK